MGRATGELDGGALVRAAAIVQQRPLRQHGHSRQGLLESRWGILCPRCRISKATTANIGELLDTVHCDACNIDFGADFARNVELSFSPSPSIRSVEYGYYCRSGPGFTPHIKGQCTLDPGISRSLPASVPPGEYRIPTLEAGDELSFTHNWTALPEIKLLEDQLELGGHCPAGQIVLHNNSPVQRTFAIEDRSWLDEVLTAKRVTTMQAFRDLFSDQVLRPGDEASVIFEIPICGNNTHSHNPIIPTCAAEVNCLERHLSSNTSCVSSALRYSSTA